MSAATHRLLLRRYEAYRARGTSRVARSTEGWQNDLPYIARELAGYPRDLKPHWPSWHGNGCLRVTRERTDGRGTYSVLLDVMVEYRYDDDGSRLGKIMLACMRTPRGSWRPVEVDRDEEHAYFEARGEGCYRR